MLADGDGLEGQEEAVGAGKAWTVGDPPEEHPLWFKQIARERYMSEKGAGDFREAVAALTKRKQMDRLKPMQGYIREWVPILAKGIMEWKRAERKRSGPVKLAFEYLDQVDPYVAALITLRAVLDGIMVERLGATILAIEIGRTIEHELQVRSWEKQDPTTFYAIEKMLRNDGATSGHTERVHINRFNQYLKEGKFASGWDHWSEEAHLRVGIELIHLLTLHIGHFKLEAEGTAKTTRWSRVHHVLVPTDTFRNFFGEDIATQERLATAYRPTLIPPKRWDGTRDGGYYTPYVMAPRLIRFKAHQENQKQRAADEYDALDMPEMYDAIHMLQEVPWRVNGKILAVAQRAWDMGIDMGKGLGIGKLPIQQFAEAPHRSGAHEAFNRKVEAARAKGQEPPKPSKELEEVIKDYRRRAKRVKVRNIKKLSVLRLIDSTLSTARQYKDEVFYFPHMLDFRGRIYPIPTGLQPQGNDLARGLLEFAEGKRVGDTGGAWLAINVANMWGNDKISFQERVDWVVSHDTEWRIIAADPLGKGLDLKIDGKDCWSTCGEPFQALAAIMDYVGFLTYGDDYVSHRPIAVDGTCNGIQHLSAMVRDKEAGQYVNLVPTERPQDIYQEVANRVLREVKKVAKRGTGEPAKHARWWLKVTDGKFPRSLTKRQTMVLPYGGEQEASFQYTLEWMEENCPLADNASPEEYRLHGMRASFLAKMIYRELETVVARGVEVQKWLQACAEAVSKVGQPIFWITPANMVVRHFYGRLQNKTLSLKLSGERIDLTIPEYTKELDKQSQRRGVPPNFTHSIDASCLVTTTNMCPRAGITAFTAVHDAYGTHAADMWTLYGLLREAFVWTHKHDILGIFRDGCRRVLVDHLVANGKDELDAVDEAERLLPKPLEHGELDIEGVLSSDYFFA